MNTKKKLHLSIGAATYGFCGAILYPVFLAMSSPNGFDTAVNDETLIMIMIDLIIGIVGVFAAIIFSRKLSKEKIEQLSNNINAQNICSNCRANVQSGTPVCPKCGHNIIN